MGFGALVILVQNTARVLTPLSNKTCNEFEAFLNKIMTFLFFQMEICLESDVSAAQVFTVSL